MTHPSADALFDHLRKADASVASHAAECEACREELARLGAVVAAARAIEPAPASPLDDDVAVAMALDELPEPLPARPRWPVGIALAAAAVVVAGVGVAYLGGSPPVPVETYAAVDATSGALLAEVVPSTVVSFGVPARVTLDDGVIVTFDAGTVFAVLDMVSPDLEVRLHDGTIHWDLSESSTPHTLTVSGPVPPILVRSGAGEAHVDGVIAAAPASSAKGTRRRAVASDVDAPQPDPFGVIAAVEGPGLVAAPPPLAVEAPIEPVVEAEPGPQISPEALYAAAQIAMVDGDDAQALKLLNTLATRYPTHPNGHLALFDRARILERTDRAAAKDAWRQYTALGPDEPLYDAAMKHLCRMDPASCR